MRTPRAFLHAMRNLGPGRAPLDELLDAARAPATADELGGEKAAVAAFTAHRRRAARAARRRPARTRTAIVAIATGLALLSATGAAVAARTGNLPQDAQQHAHRLFSALGVPAPRTGAPPSLVTSLSWCDSWHRVGPTPLSGENRRKLLAAAGGEDGVERYCAGVRRSAAASEVIPQSTPPSRGSPATSGATSSAPTSPVPTSPAPVPSSPADAGSPPAPPPTSAPSAASTS